MKDKERKKNNKKRNAVIVSFSILFVHYIHSKCIHRRDDVRSVNEKKKCVVCWWYNQNICFHSEANFCKLLSAFASIIVLSYVRLFFSSFFFLTFREILQFLFIHVQCAHFNSVCLCFVYFDSLFTFLFRFYGFVVTYMFIPFAHFSRMHFDWGRPKVRATRLVTYATHTQNNIHLVLNTVFHLSFLFILSYNF